MTNTDNSCLAHLDWKIMEYRGRSSSLLPEPPSNGPIKLPSRRKFNRSVAWWLWQQGGASTSVFHDLPVEMCKAAVVGIRHEFDIEGLKRELVAGCLVEKGGGTIYFAHRSIQEFL